jgi:pSer/pThr/pTyr-binding forkhead associated (FHA) protein
MARLFDFIVPVRRMALEEFAREHPEPFLLLARDPSDRANAWSFETETLTVGSAKVATLASEQEFDIAPEIADFAVFPVTKAPDNPWPERISVGRARNNDVTLADGSVSKLHAHFKLSDSAVSVVDAGSRNGTRINARTVAEGEEVRVRVGDTVTFGRVQLTLLDAEALYQLVSRHVRERAPPAS